MNRPNLTGQESTIFSRNFLAFLHLVTLDTRKNWVELTFAKTSGTVSRDRGKIDQ